MAKRARETTSTARKREEVSPARRRDDRHLRRLRRRAYKHLRAAMAEGRDQFPPDWLAKGDPDLESLRTAHDEEWQLLVQRSLSDTRKREKLRGSPERPWGSPAVRLVAWRAALAAVATLVVGLAIVLNTRWLGLALVPFATIAGIQMWRASREQQVARSTEQTARQMAAK